MINSEDLERFSHLVLFFISFHFSLTKLNWWYDKCHFSVLPEVERAEGQVMELLKYLNLSCRAAKGSKGENIIYMLLPAAQQNGLFLALAVS